MKMWQRRATSSSPGDRRLDWESWLIGKKPAACSLEKSLCTDRGELSDNSRGRKDVSALTAQERSAFCLRELGGMGRSQRHPEAVENTREWGLGCNG